ncbi:MAG: phosphatidate cytidylyltransferase [Lachnospiraceae bacterium]|nr:phosphatidate cytidylyltransferase [Lachnospiraceae bacterium]
MFKQRLLSGIVLVVLMVAILYLGGYVTGAAMLLLSLGGIFELLRIYKLHNTLLGYAGYVAAVAYYILLFTDLRAYILFMFIIAILVILGIYVFAYPKYTDKDIMAVIFSFFYVAFMLSYVYEIRILAHGGILVIMIFICSWVNDTLAYCAGVTMGKHKMSPKLSPKKSVEGLIGGLLGAAIVGGVYGYFLDKYVYDIKNSILVFAIIGLLGAVVAVIGDLTASAIKRNNDIKDYSKLIPGHGGILDRFDSIIFTAPVIYYLIMLMIK